MMHADSGAARGQQQNNLGIVEKSVGLKLSVSSDSIPSDIWSPSNPTILDSLDLSSGSCDTKIP